MATSNEYINVMTPFGELIHLYLAKEDTKFDPKYCVDLVLDPDNNAEHKEFMEHIDELNETVGNELLAGIARGAKSYRIKDMFREIEDEDGNGTGKFVMKATTKKKPVVKDAAGVVMPDAVLETCYSGSVGRLILGLRKSTVVSRKTVGLTVYLNKVQISEPKFGTPGSGDFGKVDGFTVGAQTDGNSPDF